MKHQNLATPVQLLRSHKSTPTSHAAYAVAKAMASAADSNVLHAVDSAVGAVFYSAVYGPVYIRTWRAVSEIHGVENRVADLARIGMVDRLLKEAHQQAATRIGDDKHIETQTPEPPEAPEIVAPGNHGKPLPWGFTIALLMLGSLFALAIAQFEPREPEKPAANSPTPVPSATPDPLANLPATGKVIEHAGGYWQWDGQEWKPVPRAIPVGRKL